MPHIQRVPAFDVISVKKEHSHMSQIPAAATPKNNSEQQNNKSSDWGSVGAGARVPFQVQLQQLSSKPSEREPLFSSQSAWLEPDPVSSSLVEDNMFLQFDSKSTFSYDLFIFFSSPLSLIYNSFDLKFH